MRKIFLFNFFLFCLINFSLAQKPAQPPSEEEYSNYPYSIGPYIGIKGGVNAASVPTGIENGIAVNEIPDFGINFYLPLTSRAKFGIAFDILFSNYFYRLNYYNAKHLAWKDKFKYFTLGASVHASGFIVGLNFGLPLGGDASNGGINQGNLIMTEVKSEKMSFLVELRLGGMLPLYEDETGRLNIVFMGGYFITAVYTEDGVKTFWGKEFYPHPATLSLGLNYLFNLNTPIY